MNDCPQPLTLLVQTDDGKQATLTLRGPGGHLRVGVGEPGRRSSLWRVWANRKTSDVYVAVRAIAGILKVSLHETGDWRHQWIMQSETGAAMAARLGTRIIDQWPRPPESGRGVTEALTIWVPWADLPRMAHDEQPREGVIWLPQPAANEACGIRIALWEPERGFVNLGGTIPVGGFALANGHAALVLATRHELQPDELSYLSDLRGRVTEATAQLALDDERLGVLRAIATTTYGAGRRMFYDLAVTAAPSG